MAGYSVVSQAELRKMGSSHPLNPKARAKGYSVTKGPASHNTAGGVAARNKQAAKARKALLSKSASKMKGGVSRQPRHPAGTSRGGQWRGKGG